MRITIRKSKSTDFMGGRTTVTKITIDGASEADLLNVVGGARQNADRQLGGPVDADAIEVGAAMQAAARNVFLSPDRVEALRETLCEVYRAMERARRAGR